MNNDPQHIESLQKSLLSIWHNAAAGDISAELKSLNKNLTEENLSLAALFDSNDINDKTARDLCTQIKIRGHLNQFVGLQSGRIKDPADRLAAIEESDRHLAKAFALAKTTSLHPIEQTSPYTLESSICHHVQPVMDKLKPAL